MRDQTLRKTWLSTYILRFLLTISSPFIIGFFAAPLSLDPQGKEIIKRVADELSSGVLYGVIYGIIFLVAAYRCAYRKPGTKLLTFLIVMTIPLMVLEIFSIGSMRGVLGVLNKMEVSAAMSSFINIFIYLIGFSLVVDFVWFVLAIKLRGLNKAIQSMRLKSNSYFKQPLAEMKKAETLPELREAYSEALEKYPNEQGFFKRKFKEFRRELYIQEYWLKEK